MVLRRRRAIVSLLVIAFFYYFVSSRRASPSTGSHKFGDDSGLPDHEFRWEDVVARYPVKSPIQLPAGPAEKLPRVQHDFGKESREEAAIRKSRQASVKIAFEKAWRSYRSRAWMRDELSPLTGGYKDHFGGWAATLVDSLDTLWIMGMKDEFEEAVTAASAIDLSRVSIEKVNVFETTIRHLGGLLAAYDLSGDERLLDKATEFGHMLLVAFDTPNRMPIARWNPQVALKAPQVADQQVLVAEIGSLSLEFTRLSQLTGDPKWYDATNRLTQLFAKQQDRTHLPGMWPILVNAKARDLTQDRTFTLNAMSDSVYEYFPKMHALLGGVDDIYRNMYKKSTTTAIKHMLWRPMLPDDTDVLISGIVTASHRRLVRLRPEGQHLGCFTGGMFALGGKLFGDRSHVEIGRKLTKGCIWTYDNSPLGIMPEVFEMVPCVDMNSCHWNETAWREEIRGGAEDLGDVDEIIATHRLAKGFTDISDTRYILRPEAIESVFILYRITGEKEFREAAWRMFTAIMESTTCELANAALSDMTYSREQLARGEHGGTTQVDSMESFWLAETLKYFYLIFSEPNVISLDDFVLNTEAHPFRRPRS